jgi:hypothetical protein
MWLQTVLLATPTPTPTETGLDPNDISPGVIGFLATFGLVVVSILLFVNMNRRLRRMRYRAEHEEGGPASSQDGERPDETPRP